MTLRMLIALAFIPLLSGCVSVLPKPEIPNGLYRLGEIQPSATLSRTLVVREPEGGRVFGGKAIAAESSDGALRLIRGAEWVEPASRMLQLGLLDAFDSEGGGIAIAKGTGAPGDLELTWRLADFSVAGTAARCDLELTLLHGRTRAPLMQRRIKASAVATSESAGARANALAEAGRSCVTDAAEVIAAVDAGL